MPYKLPLYTKIKCLKSTIDCSRDDQVVAIKDPEVRGAHRNWFQNVRAFVSTTLLLICLFISPVSLAQDGTSDRPFLGESSLEYQRALDWRGVDTDINYLDPNVPITQQGTGNEPPALQPERQQTVQEQSDFSLSAGVGNLILITICLIILGVVGYMIYNFGARVPSSLAGRHSNPETTRDISDEDTQVSTSERGLSDSPEPPNDPQEALITLARRALNITVSAHSILIQRSWTAREALAHVPSSQTHREALTSLVLASERAQFGDQPVTEEEFQRHLENVQPLLGAGVR